MKNGIPSSERLFFVGALQWIFILLFLTSCSPQSPTTIYYPDNSDSRVKMAAQEIRRYIYLRTGRLLEISSSSEVDSTRNAILLVINSTLDTDHFTLKTDTLGGGSQALKQLRIEGDSPLSLLYGAYSFAEKLGVRFYLHGDVIPDRKIRFEIPDLNEKYTPQFPIRGIQPFHDFPEGPDWWTMQDYKAYLNQLVKMKMNFIGFHCYPEGSVGPEPLVWIGPKEDLYRDGTVKKAYRAHHFISTAGTWGNVPMNTSDYSHGLGQLFPSDNYGGEYMEGITDWPAGSKEEVQLFNRSAVFFGEVFAYAHSLGIKTCIGTETPLTIPSQVKERYPGYSAKALYEGMFEWIKRNYRLDYYWFWTPEGWTWGGNTKEELQKTNDDLISAMEAAEAVEAPFQLATCGWVLGPSQDRAMFDKLLPKSWPMSCINQQVGFTPVDPGFSRVTDRPLWAIPWMEDDPALTIPQLWAGRMRADAADALAYGCTGLIGIHWRTRSLEMNVSALAQAGWCIETAGDSARYGAATPIAAPSSLIIDHSSPVTKFSPDSNFMRTTRDLPVDDFYHDWALAEFGRYAADSMAQLFIQLDGQEHSINAGGGQTARLPRPATWAGGPGGVVIDTTDWEKRKDDYSFVERMEGWRDLIRRSGNLERFDYWLNQFKYLRAYGKFACTLGQINKLVSKIDQGDESIGSNSTDDLVKWRMNLMENQTEVLTYLVKYTSTPGDFGTIANWQQHIRNLYIDQPSKRIQQIIQDTLPPAAWPSMDTLPIQKIIVPAIRTVLKSGESFNLTVHLYGIQPDLFLMKYRMLGNGIYLEEAFQKVARGVYRVSLPPNVINDDFEYFLEVRNDKDGLILWPSTAGKINQTVIID